MTSGESLEIWFDVPADLEPNISQTADPWLVAMLPYGLSTGEEIVANIPADVQLLENLRGLVAVWCSWYPNLKSPVIRAPSMPIVAESLSNRRSAVFFSGGIDSWFTALRHAPDRESSAIDHADELITVHGFDIPIEADQEFDKLRAALSEGARALGFDLVVVRTNLRNLGSIWHSSWAWLTHGAGLACIALILERRYRKVAIGSSTPYEKLLPWGSHPLTDPLLSTSSLSIRHDGAAFNRMEKTTLVARHAVALANLHVCWVNGDASNCGECAKCIRTMAALNLLGAPDSAGGFRQPFKTSKLARVFVENRHYDEFMEELQEFAEQVGRPEIADAANRALRNSRRRRPIVHFADRLGKLPLLWRLGPQMRRWLIGSRAT